MRYVLAATRVTTNRAAPELERGNGPHEGEVEVIFAPTLGESGTQCWHRLSGPGLPAHLRDDGRLVCIEVGQQVNPDVGLELRRVVPFAAALQGRVVLHAAAVRVGDSVVAFIGPSGAGKSTLATAFAQLGLEVLADDLLPCRACDGRVFASPAFVPMATLHFLTPRAIGTQRHQLLPISPAFALEQLLRNGFGEIRSERVWRTQFNLYADLAAQAASFQLTLADDLGVLSAAARDLAREATR